MTLSKDIIQAFKESACGEINLSGEGIDRYLIEVPFTFSDGDHYVVLLKKREHGWVLSDEGHTFMHLSYELRENEFENGNRRKIIDEVLTTCQINNMDGELVLAIQGEKYGDALFTFIQAITRITDMTFLDRTTVKNTFREDFNSLVVAKAKEVGIDHVALGYTHPVKDLQGKYPVDARLNGITSQQILVFAIGNDDQCQAATIVLHQWEKWEEKFQSIALFRDQTEINRLNLARLSDVLGRQFPNLDSANERLHRFFSDFVIQQRS